MIDNGANDIGLERSGKIIDGCGSALEAHSGIDILLWKRLECVVTPSSNAGELRENIVPDLKPAAPLAIPILVKR